MGIEWYSEEMSELVEKKKGCKRLLQSRLQDIIKKKYNRANYNVKLIIKKEKEKSKGRK